MKEMELFLYNQECTQLNKKIELLEKTIKELRVENLDLKQEYENLFHASEDFLQGDDAHKEAMFQIFAQFDELQERHSLDNSEEEDLHDVEDEDESLLDMSSSLTETGSVTTT